MIVLFLPALAMVVAMFAIAMAPIFHFSPTAEATVASNGTSGTLTPITMGRAEVVHEGHLLEQAA